MGPLAVCPDTEEDAFENCFRKVKNVKFENKFDKRIFLAKGKLISKKLRAGRGRRRTMTEIIGRIAAMSFQNPVFIPGPTNIPEALRKAVDMPTLDHRSAASPTSSSPRLPA
jgi:hypothetical protein